MNATRSKQVVWLGNSKKCLKAFPKPVQKDMGHALGDVQNGITPPAAKPFKGVGGGVYEIVSDYATDAYRAVYAVNIGDVVYVLHAFQKKAKKGIATPKQDVDLIRQRLKQAQNMEEKG